MKTQTESKFDKVIKEGFHAVLKSIGFKKKGNNFYKQLQGFGQIINIQKSSWYTKDHIHFTINTGLFLPEHWRGHNYNHGKSVPEFPSELECIIRKRIGELKDGKDVWYDLEEQTDENKLVSEIVNNLHSYILPYFESNKTKEALIKAIDNKNSFLDPLEKLIAYSELKHFDKAKTEYKGILNSDKHPEFLKTVREYGKKYQLD